MAFNTYNADYLIYEHNYNNIGLGLSLDRFEYLFTLSMRLGNSLGLTYQQYVFLISTICIILFYNFIRRYSLRPGVVLLLYFIFPFFYDVIQIRNTISFCIVLFAIRFLEKYSKLNLFFYLLCIGIAYNFHKSSLFYILFILAYLKDYKKIYSFIGFAGVSELLLISFNNNILIKLFQDTDISSIYYTNSFDLFKALGYLIITIALIFMLMNKLKYQKDENLLFLYKIAPIVLITIPLIAYNQAFYRFFRNSLIIFYILITNKMEKNRNSVIVIKKAEIFYFFIILSISIYFFYKQLSIFAPGYENITKAILENNSLFNFLFEIIL